MKNPEIIQTADGSDTLYVSSLKEHYHSINGAVAESTHVYIQNGFNEVIATRKNINILEVGFGTGLNALLTYMESEMHSNKVNYIGVEPEPISVALASQLNLGKLSSDQKLREVFVKMHSIRHNIPFYISDNFILNILEAGIKDIQLSDSSFDLVYFDAFAPEVQPDLWSEDVFRRLFYAMKYDGVMVTYSAKGEVRRRLQTVGFEVERLAGAVGKREMLRATKKLTVQNGCHES